VARIKKLILRKQTRYGLGYKANLAREEFFCRFIANMKRVDSLPSDLEPIFCEICVFHSGKDSNRGLLGCDAV
jgi:hypothetical protein